VDALLWASHHVSAGVFLMKKANRRADGRALESMFRIITLEREFVAAAANRLGTGTSWDGSCGPESHLRDIARRANVDESEVASCEERVDGRLYRFAKSLWRGSYRAQYAAGVIACLRYRSHDCPDGRNHGIDSRKKETQWWSTRRTVFMRGRRIFSASSLRSARGEDAQAAGDGKGAKKPRLLQTVDKERIAFVKHYFNRLAVRSLIPDDQHSIATIM